MSCARSQKLRYENNDKSHGKTNEKTSPADTRGVLDCAPADLVCKIDSCTTPQSALARDMMRQPPCPSHRDRERWEFLIW